MPSDSLTKLVELSEKATQENWEGDRLEAHVAFRDALETWFRAEGRALAEDGERYRWLRERYSAADMDYKDFGEGQVGRPVAIFSVTDPWPFSFDYERAAELLDAAIDAAMTSAKREGFN